MRDKIGQEAAFCLAEDRLSGETGLRLAVIGIRKHCPEAPIYVYRPDLNSGFARWAQGFANVTVIPGRPEGAESWNCKPQALMPALAAGYTSAVWIDSDMIITRDCRRTVCSLDDRVMVVAQEPRSLPHQGSRERTCGWRLPVGRSLRFTLNSSVLRVTRHHLPLLRRWSELLADPEYVRCQKLPVEQRPFHMASDQDILNALLGSEEFAAIPLQVVRTGRDVIHAGGGLAYSVSERLAGLFRPKPTFLHAMAGKPWLWLGGEEYWSQPNFFSWHRRLLQELSPYTYEARRYETDLGMETQWMHRRTRTGIFLRVFGLGHYGLRGLPLTVVAHLISGTKRTLV